MKKLVILLCLLSIVPCVVFARSEQLLQKNLLNSSNLVSYWNFNAGNSTDYKEAHSGTDTNMAYGASYGLFGSGAHFAGNSQINTGSQAAFFPSTTQGFTWVAWLDPSGIPASSTVYGLFGEWDGCVSHGYYFEEDNSGSAINILGTGNCSADVWSLWAYTISPNVWTCVAFVRLNNSNTFYANGVSQGTNGTVTNTTATSNALIGAGNSTFNGNMDDVQFYNIALTASQIKDICSSRSLEQDGISR